jgi:hypothetical protein
MTTVGQAAKTSISTDGRIATVTFLQRGGRKQILSPSGTAPWSPAPASTAPFLKPLATKIWGTKSTQRF